MHSCHHDLLGLRTIDNILAKDYLENNSLTRSGRGMLCLFSHGSSITLTYESTYLRDEVFSVDQVSAAVGTGVDEVAVYVMQKYSAHRRLEILLVSTKSLKVL